MKFRMVKPMSDFAGTETSVEDLRRSIEANFPRLSGLLGALLHRLDKGAPPKVFLTVKEASGCCPSCGVELKVVK